MGQPQQRHLVQVVTHAKRQLHSVARIRIAVISAAVLLLNGSFSLLVDQSVIRMTLIEMAMV